MTSPLLTAAVVLMDAGIRTAFNLEHIDVRPRALISPDEIAIVAQRHDLDLVIESGPAGWTWGSLTLRGVEVRAGVAPVGGAA